MKPRGKNVSLEERELIEKYVKQGHTNREIFKLIGRTQSCVQREFKRCGGRTKYSARVANDIALELAKRSQFNGNWLVNRIEALEMQVEILHETIRELMK